MTLSQLFSTPNIVDWTRVKMVRHKDGRWDVADAIRRGDFEVYQAFQSRDVFDCDFILSFIGGESTTATFHCAYKVEGVHDGKLVGKLPETQEQFRSDHYYDLTPMDDFSDLKGRLVIEWGRGAVAWVQKFSEKEIIEILPKGQVRPFPGPLDLILGHQELKDVAKHPESYRNWITSLSQLSGVYVIQDTRNGKLYVGSASGDQGIWGRWAEYASNGHGGNLALKRLVRDEPAIYPDAFRYSIVQVFPGSADKQEVLNSEYLLMSKLGTKEYGLNMESQVSPPGSGLEEE